METYLTTIKRLNIEFRGLSGKTDVFAPETSAWQSKHDQGLDSAVWALRCDLVSELCVLRLFLAM